MSGITDDRQLMQVFYQETRSLIKQMREDLSGLSPGPKSEKGNRKERLSALRRLFRCAHTVKSSAGAVGFDRLAAVSQALERILKAAAEEKLTMTPDLVRSVGQGIETCRDLLSGKQVSGWETLMERLRSTLAS